MPVITGKLHVRQVGVKVKVSISEAARLSGISRQTLYVKYINKGSLSVERDSADKPVIDTAELLRVFPGMKLPDNRASVYGQPLTEELSSKINALDMELTATREQLQASQEREKQAQERERWLQQQIDKLTDTIKMIEHKTESGQELKPAIEPARSWLSRIFGRAA